MIEKRKGRLEKILEEMLQKAEERELRREKEIRKETRNLSSQETNGEKEKNG